LTLPELLQLDVLGFASYGMHRGLEISGVFTCNPEITIDKEVSDLLGWRASWLVRKIFGETVAVSL
jgi:hypothetical protein